MISHKSYKFEISIGRIPGIGISLCRQFISMFLWVSKAGHFMKKRFLLVTGCIGVLSLVFAVYGQPAGQQGQAAAPGADAVAAQKAIVSTYCMTCHSEKAKAAGMDSARKINFDQLDLAHVAKDAKTWELIVRKLRAGMMPPAELRRPEPAAYKGSMTRGSRTSSIGRRFPTRRRPGCTV